MVVQLLERPVGLEAGNGFVVWQFLCVFRNGLHLWFFFARFCYMFLFLCCFAVFDSCARTFVSICLFFPCVCFSVLYLAMLPSAFVSACSCLCLFLEGLVMVLFALLFFFVLNVLCVF